MLFLWNQPVGPERWRFVVDKKLKNLHTHKKNVERQKKKKEKQKTTRKLEWKKRNKPRRRKKFLLLELHLAM